MLRSCEKELHQLARDGFSGESISDLFMYLRNTVNFYRDVMSGIEHISTESFLCMIKVIGMLCDTLMLHGEDFYSFVDTIKF